VKRSASFGANLTCLTVREAVRGERKLAIRVHGKRWTPPFSLNSYPSRGLEWDRATESWAVKYVSRLEAAKFPGGLAGWDLKVKNGSGNLKDTVWVDLAALTRSAARNIYERIDNGCEPLVIITQPCQNFKTQLFNDVLRDVFSGYIAVCVSWKWPLTTYGSAEQRVTWRLSSFYT
jgi:hypothetical protein